ncbi:tRNA-specific adenosine deaminase 2-like isoform X3 [Rhodnius prolixus]
MDLVSKESWMKVALKHAEQALRDGEVPVGCLFIKHNNIIAEGRNEVNVTKNATRHAEMMCIDTVLQNHWRECPLKKFGNVTVVVTVEPCIMCAAALHDLGVREIIYGCPNDRFGGCGSVLDVAAVHCKPVPVAGGLYSDQAMSLLKKFYKGVNPNAPLSKVKTKRNYHSMAS